GGVVPASLAFGDLDGDVLQRPNPWRLVDGRFGPGPGPPAVTHQCLGGQAGNAAGDQVAKRVHPPRLLIDGVLLSDALHADCVAHRRTHMTSARFASIRRNARMPMHSDTAVNTRVQAMLGG